jgi:hypothetical protein
MIDPWLFSAPRNLAVITTKSILEGRLPILMVSHDEDDGGWQFLDGTTPKTKDGRIMALEEIVSRDQSILELADLPEGWIAFRASPSSSWKKQIQVPCTQNANGAVKKTLLIVFMALSSVGLLVGAVFHFGSLLGLMSPPRNIGHGLMLACLLILGYWSLVSNKTSKEMGKKAFNQSLMEYTPNWLKMVAGILFLYCLFDLGFRLIAKYGSGSPTSTEGGFFHSLPAFYMALYAMDLSLLYSFRQFKIGRNAEGQPQITDTAPTPQESNPNSPG